MKIGVIGSRGFIGRHLTRHLEQKGHQVTAFSSQTPGVFNVETGLIEERFKFPEGIDAVFYLSQSPFYRQASNHVQHIFNVNTLSPGICARRAREAGAKTFFYMSSGNVYKPAFTALDESCPLNRADTYALSKIHAEELLALEAGDMTVICTRLFGIFGSGQKDMLVQKVGQKIVDGLPIFINSHPHDSKDLGGIKISYLHVSDLLPIFDELCRKVFPNSFNKVNVGGPRGISLRELGETVARVLDREPHFQSVDSFRPTDLIADTTQLSSLVQVRTKPLEDALNLTFRNPRADILR
jgi:UDP-glucose 4-epimerase